MRKLCATPAAPELHVEPVIHHNSAAASRGARVQPLRLAQCSAAGTRRGRGAQTRGCEEKERFPLTAMQTGRSGADTAASNLQEMRVRAVVLLSLVI